MIIGPIYLNEYREIKPIGEPYLNRWILFECPWFGIYLHKFLSSDTERALHDHPWNFISMIIKGTYKEFYDIDYQGVAQKFKIRKRWSVAYRSAHWRHRVDLIEKDWDASFQACKTVMKPVWTIMLVSGRARPKWGFWPGGTFCWWRSYDQKNGVCESEILHTYGKD